MKEKVCITCSKRLRQCGGGGVGGDRGRAVKVSQRNKDCKDRCSSFLKTLVPGRQDMSCSPG